MLSIFYESSRFDLMSSPDVLLRASEYSMKSFLRPLSQKAAGAVGDATGPAFEERTPPPTPEFVISSAALFVRRNLTRIAAVGALAFVATFGAALFIFNKYSATAMIVVDPRDAKVTQTSGVLANIGPDFNAIESLSLIAKSDGFLGTLVDKLDLVHDTEFAGHGASDAAIRLATIEKLRNRLIVARRGTTYVIEATASSANSEMSAKLANTAAQMIIDDQSGLRSRASNTAATGIEGRLAELRARVDRAEEAAADLKAKLKVTDAGQGSTLLQRRVYELTQQLVLAGAKTGEARARLEQLRKEGGGASENPSQTSQSSVLNTLRVQYATLARQFADQSTVLGARHPEVIGLNQQLDAVRRQIDGEIGRMMTSAQTDVSRAQQQEDALARDLKQAQTESGELEPQLVKLGELDREAKAEDAVYEALLGRQKELAETQNLEPDEIRLVSKALPPTATTPGKAILAAGAAAVGLLAGLAVAFAREAMRGTLKTTRQVERVVGLDVGALTPFVGAAPQVAGALPQSPDLRPWLVDLCSSLGSEHDRDDGEMILVASALRGEGRSTIAANVAACLAGSGARVLLVEADRAPSSDTRPRFGLIDVLERGSDLKRAFVESETEDYTLLPFGGRTLDKNARANAAMGGLTLRAALQLCRRWFDFVIVDGPPVLDSGQAKLLAREAGQTLFVVEWDRTSQLSVNEALDRLDSSQTILLLNKVDIERYRLLDPGQSRSLAAQAGYFSRAA